MRNLGIWIHLEGSYSNISQRNVKWHWIRGTTFHSLKHISDRDSNEADNITGVYIALREVGSLQAIAVEGQRWEQPGPLLKMSQSQSVSGRVYNDFSQPHVSQNWIKSFYLGVSTFVPVTTTHLEFD